MLRPHSKYLVIGASAAGMAAANAIRQHDRQGSITVLSDEKDRPYFRPLIPFFISGEKQVSEMALCGSGPYTGEDIVVRTGETVTAVHPDDKIVDVRGNGGYSYDKILFATGSRPHIPSDIDGVKANGVFALRSLADARKMAERAARSDNAVMLGGGLLNLKAAFALLERGLKVTLIVYSPEVLSQLMESEDAVLIRKALDRAGLSIKTGCRATAILSDSTGVSGVALDDGSEIACQMVCIGKGVRANTELVHDTNIQIDEGIVVDRHTACSAKDCFAAGDVAATFDSIGGERIVTALWTNAVEMGRCAGTNMAGLRVLYNGTFGILNATQVAELPFVSMGTVHTGGHNYEIYKFATEHTYRKIVFNEDGTQLTGVVFIGDIKNAGLYRCVIREKMPVVGIKKLIINHSLHYGHLLSAVRHRHGQFSM